MEIVSVNFLTACFRSGLAILQVCQEKWGLSTGELSSGLSMLEYIDVERFHEEC